MRKTLVDAGPLVAVFNRKDRWHDTCRTVLRGLPTQLHTTLPALTEAMYLLGRVTPACQGHLWTIILGGNLILEDLAQPDL